jgi:hypothetical protein
MAVGLPDIDGIEAARHDEHAVEPSCLKMKQGCLSFGQVSSSLLSCIRKYFDYSKVKFQCRQATVAFLLLVFFGVY